MASKKKVVEEKIEKCHHCKKMSVTFRIHECERACQEYYGCNFCDDSCISCRKKQDDIEDKKK